MRRASAGRNVAVVIADEPDVRELLADTLHMAKFTVHSTGTRVEGFELVRVHSPVVTTLDIDVPAIDDFEAVKRLRAFSGTYLIVVAARHSEVEMLRAYESGADSYLTKPLRPLELRARVEAMLRRPRTR